MELPLRPHRVRPDVAAPEAKPEKHVRTHWDMLLERRTIADLEALLEERLALLHEQRGDQRDRRCASPPSTLDGRLAPGRCRGDPGGVSGASAVPASRDG